MNANVLAGTQCPKCKSDGPFRMDVSVFGQAIVFDDGVSFDDMRATETEFPEDGHTECLTCGHDGSTSEFFLPEERVRPSLIADEIFGARPLFIDEMLMVKPEEKP